MNKPNIVMYGLGAVGQLIARLLLERGLNITGAVGRVNNVGRDVGEIIGWPAPIDVILSSDVESVLNGAKAEIAIMSVHESIDQSMANLEICARAGLNVLSLSEHLFYPWRSYSESARKIDSLAKENGVTIMAGGIQDVIWNSLVSVLSGASQKITSIEGMGLANADDLGPAISEELRFGHPPEEFPKMSVEGAATANLFTIALECLAAELGLTVTGWRQDQQPIIAISSVVSSTTGRKINPGQIIGVSTLSEVMTKESIILKGDMRLKVFEQNDTETSRWVINGEPTLRVECAELPGAVATCTAIINRIPDIITARPGLITVDQLPKPKYQWF